ncbi:MAG TPA: hypothetical protein VMW60_01970 [Dehalococcoidales bacterium]|nr:hypothetical protein [Dehalococcoidales bacterium]
MGAPDLIAGSKVLRFFRSKGYEISYKENDYIALKPKGAIEVGYLPLGICIGHPYPSGVVEQIMLKREGYTWEDFESWYGKHG